MKNFSTYNDSGVQWIGNIPKHWKIIRLKYFTKPVRIKSLNGSEELLSVSENYGIIPRIEIREDNETLTRSESLEGYLKVKKGDLVNNIMLMWKRGLGVSNFEGIVSPAYSVFRFMEGIPNYFNYLLRTDLYTSEFRRNSTGVIESRLRLYDDSFGDIFGIFPPIEEQSQIVSYLNQKTSIIDALIQGKLRKIELLKEYRTIIINQAVTKGLNPEVRMKESGVEWVGEIPEHWKFAPLKYFVKDKDGIKTGPFGTQLNTKDYEPSGIKILNQKTLIDENYNEGDEFLSHEKFDSLREFEVRPGDIIMGTRGSYSRTNRTTFGKCSIVPQNQILSVLHPCLIRIRLDFEKIINEYFYYYVNQSSIFLENVILNSNSTTIEVIYGITLREIKFVIPPLSEQIAILAFITNRTSEIDKQVDLENRKIALLKEYRQSLISEVVTGKIDVRTN